MIKPFDYYKLQSRLFKKAAQKVFPIKAMFELTYRCNLKCRHCYVVPSAVNERLEELETKQVFTILDQLAGAGCLNIGFTGGEPFLRKDIFEILGYAKNKGLNVIVLTNGTLITPEKANRLEKLGLNKIDISFHTTHQDTFDWFTKTAGTYTKVVRSIGLLRERGIEVYLKATAMTINKDDLVQIRHLAVKKFGAHFRLSPEVTPAWDRGAANLRFRLAPEEIQRIVEVIQEDSEVEFEKLGASEKENRKPKRGEKRVYEKKHDRLFHCGAGRTEVAISPYGEMRLCLDIPEPKYNILEGSFSEGWKRLADYTKNTQPGPSYQCRGCGLVQYCNFCPARGWLACGDKSACPPYYRRTAELMKGESEKKDKIVHRPSKPKKEGVVC
jgi:MoaA/NifB/PqqE/SkfB family radical SAM enzyme